MLIRLILLYFTEFVFTPTELITQNTNVKFNQVAVEDGLSQNFVNCIMQDSRGFLWFGTQDGLNLYDGYNYKDFRHEYEISGSKSDILKRN